MSAGTFASRVQTAGQASASASGSDGKEWSRALRATAPGAADIRKACPRVPDDRGGCVLNLGHPGVRGVDFVDHEERAGRCAAAQVRMLGLEACRRNPIDRSNGNRRRKEGGCMFGLPPGGTAGSILDVVPGHAKFRQANALRLPRLEPVDSQAGVVDGLVKRGGVLRSVAASIPAGAVIRIAILPSLPMPG